MSSALESMVATTYVSDIGTSRAFYELLGFREHSSGQAATSGWCSLHHGTNQVLLASTTPPLDIPALPLLFYFFEDVDAVADDLRSAGVLAEQMGYPAHAMGGELRLTDPDGNTVLIGQRTRSVSQSPLSDDEATSRFSLLRAAAAVPGGQCVWACLDHADEILVVVRGAFITLQDGPGIKEFLARRASGNIARQAAQ